MTTLDRSEFGPNQWLIDEMFRRFRENPDSVGDAWKEFFEDYAPSSDGRPSDGRAQSAAQTASAAPPSDGQATKPSTAPSEPARTPAASAPSEAEIEAEA